MHPLNTLNTSANKLFQCTLSIQPLITYTFSTQPLNASFNTPIQYTLRMHPFLSSHIPYSVSFLGNNDSSGPETSGNNSVDGSQIMGSKSKNHRSSSFSQPLADDTVPTPIRRGSSFFGRAGTGLGLGLAPGTGLGLGLGTSGKSGGLGSSGKGGSVSSMFGGLLQRGNSEMGSKDSPVGSSSSSHEGDHEKSGGDVVSREASGSPVMMTDTNMRAVRVVGWGNKEGGEGDEGELDLIYFLL